MLQVRLCLTKIASIVAIIVSCLLGIGLYCLISHNNAIEKQYQRVIELNELVKVGMDIDEAATILRMNGFDVGKKHSPTAEDDYFVVHIKIFDHLTLIDNLAETYGFSWSSGLGYVALEAGADNLIFNIIVR